MNITTLINDFRDALQNNDTLTGWALVNYGHVYSIFKGVDVRNPPGQELYPVIHLYPISKRMGHEEMAASHIVGITCGVYDSGQSQVDGALGNSREYDGIDLLEAFRKLVETALLAAIPVSLTIDSLNVEYETIEFYPFLLCSMEMKLSQAYLLGCDLFE